MKNKFICVQILLISLVNYPCIVQAQFLKKMMNTIKQTGQNRVTDRADQATNQTINNAVSKKNKGTTPAADMDTTSMNKVLDAFGKAAQQNPNDSSAADLTMKALGVLTGGGGVSPEDSAEALKRFTSAKGGKGYYYEILTVSTSKKITSTDTAKSYFTNAGEARSEMRINIPGAMTNQFINLGNAANIKYSVMLYPETKTYALNIIDTSLINSSIESYEVTKLGIETVQGFNCTHARIKSTIGRGIIKSSSTMDVWTSADVPGYSLIKKVMFNQNVKPQLQQALERNGCDGYLVKMSAKGKDYTMETTLVKATAKTFPAALFRIPDGYKKSNENMMTSSKK